MHRATIGPAVSVIVPCRNERTTIDAFMRDLLAQRPPEGGIELLIVDGASDDGTREILDGWSQEYPNVRVIDNPRKIVSCGMNRAIEVARGATIVRMDVHTRYADDYVERCVETLETTGAANVGGPARTVAEGRMGRTIAAAYGSRFAVGGAQFHFPDYEGEVDTVTYGCWRRDLFDEVGLFDENLVRNQDDEHNLRIRRAGHRIWQSPAIQSWYQPRASLRALARQYYQYGYWKVAVIRKHRIPASVRHLVPSAFVATLALLAVAATFSQLGRLLLVGLLAIYATFVLAGSVGIAARKGWTLLPLLPLTIATFHVSYGVGFLNGLLGHALGRGPGAAAELTR